MLKYICNKCDTQYIQKMGKCSNCGEFGTIEENNNYVDKKSVSKSESNKQKVSVSNIKSERATLDSFIAEQNEKNTILRNVSNNESFNTFFGGGLASGSINLISGEPGVGKSTFLGYIPKYFPDKKVLYISGEETTNQILDRVRRMKKEDGEFKNLVVYYENSLEEVLAIIEKENADILIIDSLQTLKTVNSDGEESGMKQQKYITKELVHSVKRKNLSTFLIGHLTTNGDIAGAKFIEHYVDSVIKIEAAGERGDDYKLMKNLKNRFSGEDLMVYEMYENEIRIVSNKDLMDLFVKETAQGYSGNALSAIKLPNANQVFLIEIQSIMSESDYPKKIINNFNRDVFDNLVKIIGVNVDGSIFGKDVSVNLFSPLKHNGDELGLGIVMSMFSFLRGYIMDGYVFLGKVGFRGEIKSINRQKSIIEKLKNYGVSDDKIISNEKFKNIRDIAIYINKNCKKEEKK